MTDLVTLANRRLNSEEGLPASREVLNQNIIEFYEGGKSQNEIAQLYGISQGYVSKVLKKHRITIRGTGKGG
ncbi:MAG TPA: hypothetical protein VF077_09815 [Nitrospiraceae bacterium]